MLSQIQRRPGEPEDFIKLPPIRLLQVVLSDGVGSARIPSRRLRT